MYFSAEEAETLKQARKSLEGQSKRNKEDVAVFSDTFAIRAVGGKGGRTEPAGELTADTVRGSQHGDSREEMQGVLPGKCAQGLCGGHKPQNDTKV